MVSYQRLSALDTIFLNLESTDAPMHTGSVAVFDPSSLPQGCTIRVDTIRCAVTERLHLVPKLRQRLSYPAGPRARPVWVQDAAFDIRRHVRHATVGAPGSDDQLMELAAELLSYPLDRAHPLWELWLIDGLAAGRFAVVEKVHHAMADGIASAELATVLLDTLPARTIGPGVVPEWHPKVDVPAAVLATVLFDQGVRNLRAAAAVLRHPLRRLRDIAGSVVTLRSLITPRMVAPHSSINGPIASGRRLRVVKRSLADLQRVERTFDVTINDILLAAVAGGLRALLDGRGELESSTELQALVPVATSLHGDRALGNQVSAMIVRLPVDKSDAVTRLRDVAHAVAWAKVVHQARATELVLRSLERMPTMALGAASQIVDHQPFVNLVVTNVPGPPMPLYLSGARLLEVIPVVPLAGNLTVGVAAFSYDGGLSVGIFADRNRYPDIDLLADGVRSSFAELVSATKRPSRPPRAGMSADVAAPGHSVDRPSRFPRKGRRSVGAAAAGTPPTGVTSHQKEAAGT